MKIIVSKYAGFCFGVKRAVNITEKTLNEKDKVFSLGPIIHNNWVVKKLSDKGLKVIKSFAGRKCNDSIILPSHGIDKKKISKYTDIDFLHNEDDFGYAKGNNIGMQYLAEKGCEYILLLNNDTVLRNPDFPFVLMDELKEDPDAAVAGPKVVAKDDVVQKTILPYPTFFKALMHGYFKLKMQDYDKPQNVDAVDGCCFMVRADVFTKTGGFDEKLFLYEEEIEWNYRIRKQGLKVRYNPVESIVHFGKVANFANEDLKRETIILMRSNRIYILYKHNYTFQGFLTSILILLDTFVRILFRIRIKGSRYGFGFFRDLYKAIKKKKKLAEAGGNGS